jgi:putative tricarboxylic transport membrane protein
MPAFIRNPKDFFAGLIFLAIAGIFALGIPELPIGTSLRMGPGYFPLVLILLLTAFGLGILINGLRSKGEPIGDIPWRALILITIAIVFFGFTLRGLGLVPSLAITVLITTFGSRQWTWRMSLALVVGIVASSVGVFVYGLGLPIPLLGPWAGGY